MDKLEKRLKKHIDLLVERYSSLEHEKNSIISAYLLLEECYENGGKLLVAGNGGSAADAEHIVGESMKGFKMPRKPKTEFAERLIAENQDLGKVLAENLQGALSAIAMDGHPALSTAYMNDCEPLLCFAQQVNGYGKVKKLVEKDLHTKEKVGLITGRIMHYYDRNKIDYRGGFFDKTTGTAGYYSVENVHGERVSFATGCFWLLPRETIETVGLIMFVPIMGYIVYSKEFYTLWQKSLSPGEIKMVTILSTITVIQQLCDCSLRTSKEGG